MRRTSPQAAGPDTGVSVGLLVASGIVPGTFARSLSVRSAADQGIVTGLSTGLHYLLTVGTQDALQAVAAELAGATIEGAGSAIWPCSLTLRSSPRGWLCNGRCRRVRASRWRAVCCGRPGGAWC